MRLPPRDWTYMSALAPVAHGDKEARPYVNPETKVASGGAPSLVRADPRRSMPRCGLRAGQGLKTLPPTHGWPDGSGRGICDTYTGLLGGWRSQVERWGFVSHRPPGDHFRVLENWDVIVVILNRRDCQDRSRPRSSHDEECQNRPV